MKLEPTLINGNQFEDNRGKLRFVNDFLMKEVKRMYIIEHPTTKIIRAWQGHKIEQKWFFVLEGRFEMHLVEPNDWINPIRELPVNSFQLSAEQNDILHVPGGFANGFRALQENSKLLVFSNLDIQEAAADNFRFEQDLWYKWTS